MLFRSLLLQIRILNVQKFCTALFHHAHIHQPPQKLSLPVVTYARHLQNLDEGSGLPTAITRALQEQDIQFVNTGMDDGWDSCYPGRRFTPIYNENLAYYDSTVAVGTQSYHPVIYELPVDTDGDGGLFESFRGTLRNIRLCGAQISAGGNAGGLHPEIKSFPPKQNSA